MHDKLNLDEKKIGAFNIGAHMPVEDNYIIDLSKTRNKAL